jgi:hypothetical protein
MKPLAYVWIAFGLLLFASAIGAEHRGIVSVTPPFGAYGVIYTAKKADDPRQFHNLMTYVWIRAFLVLGGGVVLVCMCRHADQLDPLSPTFNGNPELDELGKELDAEKRKRERPL